MMRSLMVLVFLFGVNGLAVSAKPLVTSSEETPARLCLARDDTPARIVAVCDLALGQARLTSTQRAEILVAQGDGFLWQDAHSRAATAYRRAAEIDPGNTEAWNGLGWSLWDTEGDAAAHDAFAHSLSIGVTVQGLGGKAATARRMGLIDNDTARDMLRAGLAIDPGYIWAHREVAWSHFEDRAYPAARAAFQSALDIDPRDTNARYGMGRVALAVGEAEPALAYFDDLLLDTPRDLAALVYRIVALRNLDRNAQAVRMADRLIETYPDRSSGYVEKGQALVALERRAEALDTYREAETRLGPDNAVLYWHANLLADEGRLQEAMVVIDRGLDLPGVDHTDHLLKSYIALELGDYPTARAAAEASLAMGSDDPWAHYYIAITLIHADRVAEGLARFDLAIARGLPTERIGAFATELVGVGNYVEAAQLRLKY